MRMLVIGSGGVGESIVQAITKRKNAEEWLELVVLGNRTKKRGDRVIEKLSALQDRFVSECVDASSVKSIADLAKRYNIDLIMDAASPKVTNNIFDAAYEAGCNYINMGTWSRPDTKNEGYLEFMTEYNFNRHEQWKEKGLTAILGLGIDPGVVDVFAKFGAKHLFDTIEEIHVKDGNNLQVEGMDISFGFNVWTVLDEVMNPNVEWDSEKGYVIEQPFAGEEIFDFPESIGSQKLVKVEHEETVFMPRFLKEYGLKKCTFKIALDESLINALKVVTQLGLRNLDKIDVGGVMVSPRDVVAAAAPQPKDLGDNMKGKMCVGVDMYGIKDGMKRNVFMYQIFDNEESMEKYGCQAVVAQTGLGAAIGIELLARKIWNEPGVYSPEFFDPEVYLMLMKEYDFTYMISERDSEYKRSVDIEEMKKIFDGIEKTA